MSLIHSQSCDCAKSELDLFAVPLTQTSIEDGRWVERSPLSSVTSGHIEFKITGSESKYLDFANTYIVVKAKIVEADNANMDAGTDVGPVNLFLHSIFKQVDLVLGDTLVSHSEDTYSYRAYLETLLSYGVDAKKSQLTAALWYKDTSTHMGAHADNTGYQKRKGIAAESTVIEMCGKLHLDLMFQDRYLLNGVDAKIKLVQNSPTFCLIGEAGSTQKFVLLDVKLMLRQVEVSSAVQLAHERALQDANAKYPIRRVICKSYNIGNGVRTHKEENLFTGQLPKRIVIGMVTNEAYSGSITTNPYKFEPFGVQEINLSVDGHHMEPLQPNFTSNEYIQSYLSLFSGTGHVFKDDGNDISREEYKSGYTLWAFDLTPDMDESGHVQLVQQGVVSLNLKFGAALANAITVVTYAEFENLIEVDKHRQVIFDYSS